jgi:hypothetical protein
MRIKGELQKLGIRVSASASAKLPRRHGIGPAPRRGPAWSQFLKAPASGIIACDFFTVETALLKTERCVYPDCRCCSAILVRLSAEPIDADRDTVTPIPGRPASRGVQILDRARPDHDPGHRWRLASHA